MYILIGIILALIAVAIFSLYFEIGSRKKMSRFSNRADLSLEDIYQQYFSNTKISKEFLSELWNELADTLELPAGRLRPTDRFSVELAPEKGFEYDDQISCIPYLIKKRHKKNGAKPDLSKIDTIYDYIDFLWMSSQEIK